MLHVRQNRSACCGKTAYSFNAIGCCIFSIESFGYIKACLDTGHFEAVGKDIYGAIRLLDRHLVALHVHDSAFGQDRHAPPFQALVDWHGFCQGLKDIGFSGVISLETMICSGTPQPMLDQMQRALAGIARYLAEQASGTKE